MEYEKKSNHFLIIFILLVILLHALFLFVFLTKFSEDKTNTKTQDYIFHIPQAPPSTKMLLPEIKAQKGTTGTFSEEKQISQPEAKTEKQIKEEKINQENEDDEVDEQTSQQLSDQIKEITEQIDNLKKTSILQKKPKKMKISEIFSEDKPIIPNFMQKFSAGFFNGDEGGKYAFQAIGDNTIATPEGLRYASYLQKIALALQNSWRIKQKNLKLDINREISKDVGITMTLNKKGQLTNFGLISPCGIKAIDDIVLETIEYSNPFAPIPNHLNKEFLQINFTIIVTIKNSKYLLNAY